MKIFRGIASLDPSALRDPIATIGVFDGVHRGHQHLIAELRGWATETGSHDIVVVTFEEHPMSVLGQLPPAVLTSLDHRLILLERQGLDAVVVLRFTKELASWSPERFVRDVLGAGLGCRRLLMGFDSAFGRGARGTAEYLRECPDLEIEVRSARPYLVDEQPVSSTEVRNAILKGELETATHLLGRPVSLYGEVIHGDGRGKSLGFPTANLNLFHSAAPPHGVYIATSELPEPGDGSRRHGALVNIGRRPTFLSREELDYSRYFNEQLDKVEVYIHDFDGELYGERLEITLHEKLRDERRFENSEALIRQIHADLDALLQWLKTKE